MASTRHGGGRVHQGGRFTRVDRAAGTAQLHDPLQHALADQVSELATALDDLLDIARDIGDLGAGSSEGGGPRIGQQLARRCMVRIDAPGHLPIQLDDRIHLRLFSRPRVDIG
jgi:hypothetical protein